jgi:hypothetical protein
VPAGSEEPGAHTTSGTWTISSKSCVLWPMRPCCPNASPWSERKTTASFSFPNAFSADSSNVSTMKSAKATWLS